ncbi:SRPBCC family protein [Phyllobacterium sp. 0TCS1.6C]|uniref:SRPBCC family protein n=1 Tax=unclassified Phyllobacterium TaxID=2638441 RepID=UPI002264F074|nr:MULTISPECIES: SRPBCC family protein [unclassified Phyllobacterium]MCX8281847.1 SRPBCC family protein [Phyllobacterium sp. 0TCS1.6C]MCX8295382.1 SRPBCC family protein [Phyllobacterium sp. 0TCS1.6A]
MSDRIEKQIELNAPIEKVWQALTDHEAFRAWFRVKLDAPFAAGETSTGHITYPGHEHLKWQAHVVKVEKPHAFAFTWHPYAVDPDYDYSAEQPTLVEFTLKPHKSGTLLTVVESGFDGVPEKRRDEAMRSNEGGWEEQMKNIKAYVDR